MKALVAAPWGDPQPWKPCRYKVGSGLWEKVLGFLEEGLECWSKSCLKFSAEALKRRGFNYRLVVLASSTLIAKVGDAEVEGYSEIAERAEEYVGGYLRSEEYLGERHAERAEIYVLPGVGVFRGRRTWRFMGAAAIYGVLAYYAMYRELCRWLGGGDGVFMVDLSHGVNYMPVMAREAAQLAAEAYALSSGASVKLAFINCDPVLVEGAESHVHCLDFEEVSSEKAARRARLRAEASMEDKLVDYYAPSGRIREFMERFPWIPEVRREIQGSRVRGALRGVYRVFDHGFLLYMATMLEEQFREAEKYRERLERLLEELLEKPPTVISEENSTVEVLYAVKPSWELAKLHGALLHIKALEERLPLHSGGEVSLKELRRAVDKLKQLGLSRVAESILENELASIERRLEAFTEKCFQQLSAKGVEKIVYRAIHEAVVFKDSQPEVKCPEELPHFTEKPEKRNFVAHAGFERNAVEVILAKHVEEAKLKYRDEILEEVKGIVEEL